MFRKALVAMIVCLGVVAGTYAQTSPSKVPKAVISKLEFNAGEVKEGAVVQHAFEFKNDGEADLLITEVIPNCGCETVEFDKAVSPGKAGKITIQVKTAGFSGPQIKTAVVKTNDPAKPHFELAMRMIILAPAPKGESVGPFIISPSRTISGSAVQGSSVDLVANVLSQSATPPKITKVVSEGKAFKVDYYGIPDGTRGLLKAVSSPSLEPGIHTQTARLLIDSAETPEIQVTFELQVGISLTLTPAMLVFDRVSVGQGSEVPATAKFVWLRRSGGPPVNIKKVESTLPFIKGDVEGNSDGRTFIIRVKFSGVPPKGTSNGKLVVMTDSPSQPSLEANLRVVVP